MSQSIAANGKPKDVLNWCDILGRDFDNLGIIFLEDNNLKGRKHLAEAVAAAAGRGLEHVAHDMRNLG